LPESTHDFGRVTLLEAEALGKPGERTFRLRIGAPSDSASLWLEKEQLQALSLAVRHILSQRRASERPTPEEQPPAPADFAAQPAVDFKVGRLSLGYDESEESFTLFAHDLEADPEGPPTFTCEATAAQARALSDEISRIVAAGRPVCYLCGQPIEAGHHVCPRSNGHGQPER
jgi:uncharacterized repeat protein (TIGR03847 family)